MVGAMGTGTTPEGDNFEDLSRELRERVGPEVRADAEASEADAATVEMRRRQLHDVARELASRGDEITVFAGDRSARGTLTYARGDIAELATASGPIDVHLAAGVALRVDHRVVAGGTDPRSGSDTLRARLLEHELAGHRLEIWMPRHGLDISGRLVSVGKDHAVARDGDDREWTISLMDIAWVRSLG